jgi:DNA-binding NtrC family response regulator
MGTTRSAELPRIAPRLPCFSRVLASGLPHCWMTNISAGGVGLSLLSDDESAIPQRGDDIELEITLGDAAPIRAVGRVAWTSRVDGGRLGFGVEFREISQRGREQLARFLAEHKPRVVVAFADPDERALVEACLGDLHLEFVDHVAQLDPETLRRSASVIVFAHALPALTALLDALHGTASALPIALPTASVTVVTTLDTHDLLPLFSSGQIYDLLRPPLDPQTLVRATEHSCERWALKFELRWASLQLEGAAPQPPRPQGTPAQQWARIDPRSHIIRASAPMQHVYRLIETVAVHDVPVLLQGETGTGKELAAREIHALSKRAHTPFVAQDCGALIETLLESELFGHVRGAFTGAVADHPGLFQIADGGTIFLDEIQNTSPALQAKLLRVVEEGEVRPVGGVKPRRVNVRLIAACNVSLEEAVTKQRFRSDFYYRLNRFPIRLPALRDHADDIIPLVRHFMQSICASLGRTVPRIEPRAERALVAYAWPGNIRELKNTVERSLLLTEGNEPLRWETLPDSIRGGGLADAKVGSDAKGLDAQVGEYERTLIQQALAKHDGVVRRAARDLSVNAVTLARRMKKLGIE